MVRIGLPEIIIIIIAMIVIFKINALNDIIREWINTVINFLKKKKR